METSNQILQDDIEHNGTTFSMIYAYTSGDTEFGVYLNPNNPSDYVILRSANIQTQLEDEMQYVHDTVESAMDTLRYYVMRAVCKSITSDQQIIEEYVKLMSNYNEILKASKLN